jgi:hypothetical protein
VEEVPEIAPEDGIEPDGRLVEDEDVRIGEQRGGERDAGALPPGKPPDKAVRQLCQLHPREQRVDRLAGGAEHSCEVREVLANAEVAVDRGRLRHVADASPEGRRSGRFAEHLDGSALHDLYADDRA